MKESKIKKIINITLTILYFAAIILLWCGGSWIITCGLIKLITLCLGLTFKWKIATGLWLILCLFRCFIKGEE